MNRVIHNTSEKFFVHLKKKYFSKHHIFTDNLIFIIFATVVVLFSIILFNGEVDHNIRAMYPVILLYFSKLQMFINKNNYLLDTSTFVKMYILLSFAE